jgi:acetyl coenzyme A synthetase (ADP forming)-like protein
MTTTFDPAFYEYDAVLTDGGVVRIRPITPGDGPRLVDFHSRLSPESIYLRYFSSHPRLTSAELERFTTVDHVDRMAFVGTLKGEIVGVARYDRLPSSPAEAEVALVVADDHHGRGLATLLLEHLAAYARTQGIRVFRAITLPQNRAMQGVFRRAGFVEASHYGDGVVEVRMEIQTTQQLVDAVDQRATAATVHSIRPLLQPKSVAVVGVGRSRGTIGHEIFRNMLAAGFAGPVYPVHPSARSVAGVRAYPSILAVPDEIDLAVIVVPGDKVSGVLDECAEKGVHGVVIISAGFAEAGTSGSEAQGDLVRKARDAGMRLVGPNCMGVINTAAELCLNATFAPVAPVPGRVAFASQSGGLGIAVLEEVRRRQIGISSFVSMGNKADVSSNDLLEYWGQDPQTDVVMLYLESFGNPRRFARIARRVALTKPIVAVKSGRTTSGRRAASSHTAALASVDTAVDALFAQAGVIRVDTLAEMFDVAQLLAGQPIPQGRRVAVVGNAGGPGILAADACEAAALQVPELSATTQAELRSFLPGGAGVSNPVDMVASASASDYERAVRLALADENIDAVLAIFVPPLVTDADEVAAAITRAAQRADKPVVASFVGMSAAPGALATPDATIPNFAFPEPAVRALARTCGYGEWRIRPTGSPVVFPDLDIDAARAVVQEVLEQSPQGGWLDAGQANRLLDAYAIRRADSLVVRTPAAAATAARQIGFPVALKAASANLVHKTEQGAVRLALGSVDEVRKAFTEMEASLGSSMGGAVVQAMAEPGVETIVGVVRDPLFGPLLMFGTGGISVELFGDRAFRILPMTDTDATALVRSVRGSALLFGYRGSTPADVAALEYLLLRVAQLASDIPDIAELDLNPVIVSSRGAAAVDVKIRVAPADPDPDPAIRRLR